MLSLSEQIKKQIDQAAHILITFKKNWDGDVIGTALGLAWFLEALKKRVTIAADGFTLPKQFRFLSPDDHLFFDTLRQLRQYIIAVDLKNASLAEFSYSMDAEKKKLHIFLTPEEGTIDEQQLELNGGGFRYDTIITLGTQDLESLGKIFEEQAEFFHATPIINLDRDPANEHFGQINHVQTTATTTAEMMFDFIKTHGDAYIDERIATALLTGIIAGTKSFRSAAITPHCLEVVSALIARGAARETIMRHLYQNRSIATLKLWGRILTHLQESKEHRMIWSTVSQHEFVQTGATPDQLSDIIDELMTTIPEAHIQLLIAEHPRKKEATPIIDIIVNVERGVDARLLLKAWNPQGARHRAYATINNATLEEVEKNVVASVQRIIAGVVEK